MNTLGFGMEISKKSQYYPERGAYHFKVFSVRCIENNHLALPPLQTFHQLQVTPMTAKTVIMAKTIFAVSATN